MLPAGAAVVAARLSKDCGGWHAESVVTWRVVVALQAVVLRTEWIDMMEAVGAALQMSVAPFSSEHVPCVVVENNVEAEEEALCVWERDISSDHWRVLGNLDDVRGVLAA